MKSKTLVIIDIETTRSADVVVNDPKPPICSFSAMAVDFNTLDPIETFNQLILFDEERADTKILELIGYDAARWQESAIAPLPAFRAIKKFLQKYAWFHQVSRRGMDYNTILPVGHNLGHFDIPVLMQWARAIREVFGINNTFLPISYLPRLDTMELANAWAVRNASFPSSFRLPDLCDHYGIQRGDHHQSDNDVDMTHKLLRYYAPILGWKEDRNNVQL